MTPIETGFDIVSARYTAEPNTDRIIWTFEERGNYADGLCVELDSRNEGGIVKVSPVNALCTICFPEFKGTLTINRSDSLGYITIKVNEGERLAVTVNGEKFILDGTFQLAIFPKKNKDTDVFFPKRRKVSLTPDCSIHIALTNKQKVKINNVNFKGVNLKSSPKNSRF